MFLLPTHPVKFPSNNKCHSPWSHDLRGLEKATLAEHLWSGVGLATTLHSKSNGPANREVCGRCVKGSSPPITKDQQAQKPVGHVVLGLLTRLLLMWSVCLVFVPIAIGLAATPSTALPTAFHPA